MSSTSMRSPFAAWARSTVYESNIELEADEAYCLRCRAAVTMRGPIAKREMKRAILVSAKCPQCGSASLVKVEGCNNCLSCGYSKCG